MKPIERQALHKSERTTHKLLYECETDNPNALLTSLRNYDLPDCYGSPPSALRHMKLKHSLVNVFALACICVFTYHVHHSLRFLSAAL